MTRVTRKQTLLRPVFSWRASSDQLRHAFPGLVFYSVLYKLFSTFHSPNSIRRKQNITGQFFHLFNRLLFSIKSPNLHNMDNLIGCKKKTSVIKLCVKSSNWLEVNILNVNFFLIHHVHPIIKVLNSTKKDSSFFKFDNFSWRPLRKPDSLYKSYEKPCQIT